MRLEEYLDFLGPDEIRLRGHRIGLEHIVQGYRSGSSADEIADEFPGVALEQIYGVLTYYLRHQADIDAYLQRQEAHCEQEYRRSLERPSPAMARIRRTLAERRRQSA